MLRLHRLPRKMAQNSLRGLSALMHDGALNSSDGRLPWLATKGFS